MRSICCFFLFKVFLEVSKVRTLRTCIKIYPRIFVWTLFLWNTKTNIVKSSLCFFRMYTRLLFVDAMLTNGFHSKCWFIIVHFDNRFVHPFVWLCQFNKKKYKKEGFIKYKICVDFYSSHEDWCCKILVWHSLLMIWHSKL